MNGLKKIIYLFVILYFVKFNYSFGQFTNVLIDFNSDPEEPAIAINPINTNQIAAGSNMRNGYHSTDGGATWIKHNISPTFTNAGDPCVIADSAGNFYYFHLVQQVDRIVCQKSSDGGMSYTNGAFAWNNNTLFEDKEWAVADPTSGNLYVTWSQYDSGNNPGPTDSSRIYFSRSTDGGNSFSLGTRINQYAGDCLYLDITDPHPFVGINGEVYVTFMDSSGIRFNKSLDSGNTWLSIQPLIDSGGQFRYNHVQGVTRLRAMPYSECDRSNGMYRGNLYVSWADQRNGTSNSDIFLIRSTDNGNSWSLPIKVNTDNSGRQQYRCALSVDQTDGYIYIVYYDRRNYVNNDSTDIYLSRSTDGGSTWVDYKISDEGFISDGSLFDGDYIDLASHDGIVRPIWTQIDTSGSKVWTALFNEPFAGISNSTRKSVLNFSINPNPANTIASISFNNEIQNMDISIFDLSGRFVLNFIMKNQREKTFSIEQLPSGIYFVKAAGLTRKLIVEKNTN